MSTRDDFEIALDHYAGCYLGRHIANREHALTNLHTSMDDVVEEARDKVLALFDAALIAPAPRPDEVTDVTLEQRIVAWQRATFPGGRVDGAVRHFDEESIELIAACKGTDEANVHEEIGDVGMLLVAIASGYGTTLSECMEGALQKVQGRTYAYDERLGYSRHVDAAAAHDRKATNG